MSSSFATQTTYVSKPVEIPPDFLIASPPDAIPIAVERVDFASTTLSEYTGMYATVLDNVVSASECAKLLRLAESSSTSGGWQEALVNAGPDGEAYAPEIRLSERIIWDNEVIVKRIWDRCLQAQGIEQELRILDNQEIIGKWSVRRGDKWRMTRLNERMRFLKYGSGQYFRVHRDGSYVTPSGCERSFLTLHLYLNDSVETGGDVKGGATRFFSRDQKRKFDVVPQMGRILIFQHANLSHSGEEVQEGIKYTMRTDLMYERIGKDETE